MRERIYPATGFWLFICNTTFWNGDQWLALGETELLYKVSKHHAHEMLPGQLGLLRLNKDVRSARRRGGRPPHEAGIYAVVEVVDRPAFRPDPDARAYNSAADASEECWRVRLRVVANLGMAPILASSLPRSELFKHIHRPLPTSTISIREEAFRQILSMADVPFPKASEVSDVEVESLAETASGILALERSLSGAAPKYRMRVSRHIERGSVGRWVKALRGGRCQICDALGEPAISFLDRKGRPYSEAHHVIPVSSLTAGSLSCLNIMVLCPNHHRQAHFGSFKVLSDQPGCWRLDVDGKQIEVQKPPVPT